MDGASRATQDAKAEMVVLRLCREQKVCPVHAEHKKDQAIGLVKERDKLIV